MDWNQYQKWVAAKMRPGTLKENLQNSALGLAGEAGEVADIIKKHIYHEKRADPESLRKELGDCLFYVAAAANAVGFTLAEVMQGNVDKLNARYPKGFDPNRAHAAGERPIEEAA